MFNRSVYAAVLAVLFLTLSGRELYGQEAQVPCLDYFCPESQHPFFTAMALVNLDVYGTCGTNCKAWVTFKHRMACGQICDIYIEKVEFVDPTQCPCATTIAGMREAIAALLLSNSPAIAYCYPTTGNCVPALRVTIGGCYRFLYDASYDHYRGYMTCGAQICCQAEYKVCRDAAGELSFTQIDFNSPSIPCGMVPPLLDPSACYAFCEALPHTSPPPGVKTVPGGEAGSLAYILSGPQEVELYPNPATGFAVIRCKAGEVESGVLEVASVSGEIVRRLDLVRDDAGKLGVELDVTEFPSGSYNYRILSGGAALCTGVLTVTQ